MRRQTKHVPDFAYVTLLVVLLVGITAALYAEPKGDEDITKGELRRFDKFLDKHPNIATDLKKDPALVNSSDYLKSHPELGTFLRKHPEIREELKENPRAFMNRERKFEKSGGDITRRELRNFDRYLDKHPEVAKELKKDPSLVNNEAFLEKHPGLKKFLANHPGVKEELKENPRVFMNRERRFERHERAVAHRKRS